MPTWNVIVRIKNPSENMNVTAETEAEAIKSAVRGFGGAGNVEYVSSTLVPEQSIEDALIELDDEVSGNPPE